jgi:hypothetical protein
MILADVLGWVGNIGFLVGAYYIARNNKQGFYWQIEGNFFYLIQGWMFSLTSLIILSIILIVINLYGLYYWTKSKGVESE